ncbi:MAG: hypothetical protein HKO81_08370 [Flavobacteriaceae bacterium]|nr:hypothetical protein [Flavobacteriaceae bacterium]
MKKLILINAIIWATLILASAYLFKDHPNYNWFFGILLVGFTFVNSLMAKHEKQNAKTRCS